VGGGALLAQDRKSPGDAGRWAGPFIGPDSDLEPSDRLYAALFGYLNFDELRSFPQESGTSGQSARADYA